MGPRGRKINYNPCMQDHFQYLKHLVQLEGEAEALVARQRMRTGPASAVERSGQTLVDLIIRDETLGLGGQSIFTFGKRDQYVSLPWNRLGVGTPVLVTEERVENSSGWRGVVISRSTDHLQVAFRQAPETETGRPRWRIDFANDEISRQRQVAALDSARTVERGRLMQLRDVLLGARPPAFDKPLEVSALSPLNESQMEAVRFALSARDIALIHGPPGTGKTTTLVELIRQAVARGQKVLACAASNLAVDNLLEKLVAANEKAIRLGHPARVLAELQQHTLDLMVDAHPDVKIARKLVKDAMALRASAAKYTRAKPEKGARQAMRAEASELLGDARRLERKVVSHLLDSATVICATLTGLDDGLLGDRRFDLVVIDEAAQATEPASWIPLLRAERLVLGGDHCQLPPTIVSDEAARGGLGTSLIERLAKQIGPSIVRRLDVQYRMHEQIMEFSSAEFYQGELVADESVRSHTLLGLTGVSEHRLTESPLTLLDTAGASYDEEQETEGSSRVNRQEGELVVKQVEMLLATGLQPEQLAVITPYAAQARLLRELIKVPNLEIDTVDGFQGREKEAVIVSLVRSNDRGEIGFLSDVRRMNVALTRARRKLIVVGDTSTVAGHAFYGRLIEHFEKFGAYRTVWEEME
jgi:ATP-dependent RNA/DNA helicase IGHMBP2